MRENQIFLLFVEKFTSALQDISEKRTSGTEIFIKNKPLLLGFYLLGLKKQNAFALGLRMGLGSRLGRQLGAA